jgi:CheY-like chemotaxis protein
MPKVLLIEDEAPIRATLSRFLRLEGLEVLSAEDGAKGVAIALAEKPDLIICDLLMPELDGYQVLSTLRGDARTASIPFVLLTASAAPEEHTAGLQRGAAAFLTKPFHLEDVRAAIVRLLHLPDATACRPGAGRDAPTN